VFSMTSAYTDGGRDGAGGGGCAPRAATADKRKRLRSVHAGRGKPSQQRVDAMFRRS
jgi:hypothetical protein